MPRSDSLTSIALRRLSHQRLAGNALKTPEEVVGWLGAVQAQDFGAAKWGVAQRCGPTTDAELDRFFDAGKILRTHVLRPTWHFVLPADIRWMLQLSAPRILAKMVYYDRQLELTEAVYQRSNALLTEALRGASHLTRTELAEVLRRGKITAAGQRLGHLMIRAELDAIICSGPRRGKQFTYALIEERAPRAKRLSRDESLAELAHRYFTSHGPATAHDFAWWSGLTVTDAKIGTELARRRLAHETIDGKTYWSAVREQMRKPKSPLVHLLPNYDEHLVAYDNYAATFDPALLDNRGPKDRRANALFGHILVVNGRVIGGWRRTVQKKAISIETKLLNSLRPAEKTALAAAADRYAQFLGLPVTCR